jgi:phage terminase large subunit-like protein
MSYARAYADWVLKPENEKKTGRLVKLAVHRFLSDLKRTDIYFDEAEAVDMPDFCAAHLCQWEGEWEGHSFTFELWQRFFFEQVYGWFWTATKTRRFDEAYLQVSKKNGKSSMCAGASNYHVFGDKRIKTPKVFTAANNSEQARICVNMAGKMVEASAKYIDDSPFAAMLSENGIGLMNYKENITDVINYENNGFIKALSKESGDKELKTTGGKHGLNASMGVVDEFGMSPDHGASKTIRSSMASRRERLMLYITTAGFMLEGPCYSELRDIGIKVLEGIIHKDNYLPLIYEIDPPEGEDGKPGEITVDWLLENEEVWQQSNPNIDVSVMRDFLRGELQDAKVKGGTTMRDVLTLNFNMWMNSPDVFIAPDIWNKNTHGLEEPDSSEICYGGLQIAPSGELSALALLFPGNEVRIKMLFFGPEIVTVTNENYEKLKDHLRLDPGNELDVSVAIDWIVEEIQKYNFQSFSFPNTQKNNSIVQGVIKLGYTGNPLSEGILGVSNPTDEWEKMLRSFQVEHYGNPVLSLQNSNCEAVRKEQGVRLTKNSKVLGIYACISAVAEWKTMEASNKGFQPIERW